MNYCIIVLNFNNQFTNGKTESTKTIITANSVPVWPCPRGSGRQVLLFLFDALLYVCGYIVKVPINSYQKDVLNMKNRECDVYLDFTFPDRFVAPSTDIYRSSRVYSLGGLKCYETRQSRDFFL